MMKIQAVKEKIEKYLSQHYSSSLIIKDFEYIRSDREIASYISDELKICTFNSDIEYVQILLRIAYCSCCALIAEGVSSLLNQYLQLSDDDIFEVSSEIEMAFSILGKVKNESSLYILQQYATKVIKWDDMYNINKSAIYAIANIGGNKAVSILTKLLNNQEKIIAEISQNVLEKIV